MSEKAQDQRAPMATTEERVTVKENIFSYLDLSTGHVTRKDNDWLQDKAQSTNNYVDGPGLRVIGHEYGWWILVPAIEDLELTEETFVEAVEKVGLSKSFAKVVLFARKHGCRWINFDRDGDPIEGLRYFEW